MGRLTDDILAVFGVKPSDRVKLTPAAEPLAGTGQKNIESSFQDNKAKASSHQAQEPATAKAESFQAGTSNQIEEEKEDCLSCKVIGTTACFVGAAYVGYVVKVNKMRTVGAKRVVNVISGSVLATMMVILGIGRLCDAHMDINAERKEGMSIWERTVADYEDFTTPIFNKISGLLGDRKTD